MVSALQEGSQKVVEKKVPKTVTARLPFRGNFALSLASLVVGPWGLENEPKRAEKCSYLIAPDMLGAKIGMKWVPVRALKLPTISICIVFQGEAIGDDGKSPKPLFWVETADFRVDIFGRFLVDFWGAPNKRKTPF